MNDAAHTPGPWQLEGNWQKNDRKIGGWVSTMHPSPVFELNPLVGEPAEIIANGHLIAASPEMLAALKAVDAASDFGSMHEAFQMTRKAIAKAEGRV